MAWVFLPTQLRQRYGITDAIEAPGATLRQVIRALEAKHPGLGAELADEDTLAVGIAADIDGALVPRSLITKVEPDSEIHFLTAISGG